MAEIFPLLHVRTTNAGGVVTVTVRGEVDLVSVGRLQQALSGASADPDVRLLICDLTHVSFLACCGLTVLLDARRAMTRRGARLELVTTSQAVLRPIALTGLLDCLPTRPLPSIVDTSAACAGPRPDGKVGG